jgi:hypothetical protein
MHAQNVANIWGFAEGSPTCTLITVRLTMFWERMREQFGEAYAESVAKDYVLSNLGGRTVNKALADGEDVKVVWRAICETFGVPELRRLFGLIARKSTFTVIRYGYATNSP